MVILGLGSNIGDRLENLRHARQRLAQIPQLRLLQTSPLYVSDALLPPQAPASWDKPHLNLAIKCETALTPQELLQQVKNVECAMGRSRDKKRWEARTIDIDILAWDNLLFADEHLQIPHRQLLHRPFALWPLADLVPLWIYPAPGQHQGKTAAELCAPWGARFSGKAPLHTQQLHHRIDTPQLIGVLNITPDSFSDGGKFPDVAAALQQVDHLTHTGATVIDVGAEATNPQAHGLSTAAEWQRLEPVLTALQHALPALPLPPKLSIDTRHPEVAEKALSMGVDWINDTSGLENPRMRALVAAAGCDCVVMHNLGIPADNARILPLQHNPVTAIQQWGEARIAALERCGIAREKIIFDVGIGFGKQAEHSFDLIKNIQQFQNLKTRLLVGHSRKSFLQLFTDKAPAERDLETAIISIHLAQQGVDYLRVHNTEASSRSLQLAMALNGLASVSVDVRHTL